MTPQRHKSNTPGWTSAEGSYGYIQRTKYIHVIMHEAMQKSDGRRNTCEGLVRIEGIQYKAGILVKAGIRAEENVARINVCLILANS